MINRAYLDHNPFCDDRCDKDYPHDVVQCDYKYASAIAAESVAVQKANHEELKRSNDLEEQRQEIEIERMQRDPTSKPYVPYVPPVRTKQTWKGGMQVEPRNE